MMTSAASEVCDESLKQMNERRNTAENYRTNQIRVVNLANNEESAVLSYQCTEYVSNRMLTINFPIRWCFQHGDDIKLTFHLLVFSHQDMNPIRLYKFAHKRNSIKLKRS